MALERRWFLGRAAFCRRGVFAYALGVAVWIFLRSGGSQTPRLRRYSLVPESA